uniref:Uncharacterized protein n=1 Tax=Cannabis sativa TaxID=3483 RepID=A0A803QXH3_CANSA
MYSWHGICDISLVGVSVESIYYGFYLLAEYSLKMFTLLNIEAHRFGSVEENRLWHPISININLRIKNKRVKEQALDKGSQVELRGDSLLPLNLHYDVGIQLSSKEGALVTISCELIYLSWPHLVIQSVTQAPFAWEHYVSLFERFQRNLLYHGLQ